MKASILARETARYSMCSNYFTKNWVSYLRKIVVIVIAFGLTGCSMRELNKKISIEWRIKKYSIVAESNLNNGHPVAVDLVFLDDQLVADVLMSLKAAEWFGDRKDLIRKYKSNIKLISYEIVPGQIMRDIAVPYAVSKDAASLIVFSDYLGDGKFSLTAKSQSELFIKFSSSDFYLISSDEWLESVR